MTQEEDPIKAFEKRITFIESKLFQTMTQNEELVSKVESLEKVVVNKEEQIDGLVKYAEKQSDNINGLELMFKSILDESENLAFCFSMLQLKEKDDEENIRSTKEDMKSMNIALNNHNQEIDLQLLKLENDMMSEFSLIKEKLKLCSKELKAKEEDCIEKNQQNMDRIEKIEIENKKTLEYMDELLTTTVTLIKKTKEGKTSTKPDTEQNKAESEKIEHNLSFVNGYQKFHKQLHLPKPLEFPSPVSSPVFPPTSSLNPAAPPYASFVYHPWSNQE